MPKSYKIAVAAHINTETIHDHALHFTKQLSIPGVNPGPETTLRKSLTPVSYEDYQTLDIDHEYALHIVGRTFDEGRSFSRIIAKGHIQAYFSAGKQLLLLSGKKSDILDFCKQSNSSKDVQLRTIQVDMKELQQKLPEIRGVWFRFKTGFIRAKGYMGDQIQDTTEYCDAKAAGDISTLSFYFEDARDGCRHPVMITEDGTVVLQRNYKTSEEEIDFVLYVKRELLDGLFVEVEASKARTHVAPDEQ